MFGERERERERESMHRIYSISSREEEMEACSSLCPRMSKCQTFTLHVLYIYHLVPLSFGKRTRLLNLGITFGSKFATLYTKDIDRHTN